jgi:hypothetical protein
MDVDANAITAQVCMLRSTVFEIDEVTRAVMLSLSFDVNDASDGEPDDPMHVFQWVWHNGEVGGKPIPFLEFLALFTPHVMHSNLIEHEGLIIRMHHTKGGEDESTASAFLTTMGNNRAGMRVRGTLKVNERILTEDLANRLICMERLMTARPEVVAKVLKATGQR